MAASSMKLLVLIVCINTFLYLGSTYIVYSSPAAAGIVPTFQNDAFNHLLEDKTASQNSMTDYINALENDENYTSSYDLNMSQDFTSPPDEARGQGATSETLSVFSFLDAIAMVLAFIRTLWYIAIAPLILFNSTLFTPLLGWILGIPLVMLEVYTLVVLIRGGGAT